MTKKKDDTVDITGLGGGIPSDELDRAKERVDIEKVDLVELAEKITKQQVGRPPSGITKKQITVYIQEDVLEKVRDKVHKEKMYLSGVIEKLLEEWVKK